MLGILNVTPDSFSDGGSFAAPDAAIARAHAMAAEGADGVDIGGESTRPGAPEVAEDEELARVLSVLEALGAGFPALISIDTRRARVAEAAARHGARMVNDTSALRDDAALAAVVAAHGLELVLMHRKGTPKTMQQAPHYEDLLGEVRAFFEERVRFALDAGIAHERLILDPGLGFGKRPEDNYALAANLRALSIDGLPMMLGASRKSFLARFDPRPAPERIPGSLAFAAMAFAAGAAWVRVHDVGATVSFLDTLAALHDAEESSFSAHRELEA